MTTDQTYESSRRREEVESGARQHDSATRGDRRLRSSCGTDEDFSLRISESDWTGADSASSNRARFDSHGGVLRLQIKSVQNQRANLRMQLQQLDEQERELQQLLEGWEETVQRSFQ
jgi:hypothetical protein